MSFLLPEQSELHDFGTHLPILEFVCQNIQTDSIFEYGMGNFSTKLFAKHFKSVIAVEMQEQNWYETMMNEKFDPEIVTLLCLIGQKDAINYFHEMNTQFSCIFVDGHGGNRWECINEAFGKSEVIVTHDTETSGYQWNLVNLPSNYRWLDIRNYVPWTSVITSNNILFEKLQKVFKCEERKK